MVNYSVFQFGILSNISNIIVFRMLNMVMANNQPYSKVKIALMTNTRVILIHSYEFKDVYAPFNILESKSVTMFSKNEYYYFLNHLPIFGTR